MYPSSADPAGDVIRGIVYYIAGELERWWSSACARYGQNSFGQSGKIQLRSSLSSCGFWLKGVWIALVSVHAWGHVLQSVP